MSRAMAEPAAEAGRRESGITLAALRTFIAVVEAGSFSRAAAAMGVSQPSVSSQLGGLERACGVPLLRRRPRLELTEAGRDLLVRARLIVSRLAEFESSLDALRDLRRGRISVGLSGPHVAMRRIASFTGAHPAITVAMRIGNTAALLEDVAQCRVDVALVALPAAVAGLACLRIFDLRLALCVRRDHALAGRGRIAGAEMEGLAFIRREDGSVTRQVAERVFAAAGVAPEVALEVIGREAMKEAIVAGLGVGVLFAHEAEGDGRLEAVEIAGAEARAGIYAVALEESLDIPTVRAFVDHLLGQYAGPWGAGP
jgi:DNA-binding transcriptional LysR family regulator